MNSVLLPEIFVFFIGTIIGSFLNVCIVRMPHGKSIVSPGSHCVKCQKPVQWFDNIPLISFVFLRGRCRYCHERISFRYFIVELLTGITFLIFYKSFGFSLLTVTYLTMLCGFIIATFIDFEHRIIPDEISVGGMLLGFVFSGFVLSLHDVSARTLEIGSMILRYGGAAYFVLYALVALIKRRGFDRDDWEFFAILALFLGTDFLLGASASYFKTAQPYLLNMQASVIGAFVGGISIHMMGILGEVIFRKEAMGGGDVKLMAMVGAFLGWKLALIAFFLAPFLGAVYGIVELIRTKDSAIAYGPFLVLGSLISLFWGEEILLWILGGYGF